MPFYERATSASTTKRLAPASRRSSSPVGGELTIVFFTGNAPFNAIEEFQDAYRCITMDLRNANGGQSSGDA
jgi:hypothetical protein